MQMKSIAKMVIAGCAIGMLTGCGVPQEEHDAIVAQLNADHEAVQLELNTELEDTKSLLAAEKERSRTLNSDLNDSSILNRELKEQMTELKSSLATANTQISSLESKLTSANAKITAAQSMAADAENERAAAEMEAQEKERRFMALIENLVRLQKVNPSDLGWPELEAAIDTGSMSSAPSVDMGADMGMGESADSSTAASLLDEMGSM